MNLPVNAMRKNDNDCLKEYFQALNEEYIKNKSRMYSYDFKHDCPIEITHQNPINESLQIPSKVIFEVNYEWHQIKQNLIGEKKRKSGERKIKRSRQKMIGNKRLKESDEISRNISKNVSSPANLVNFGVNNESISDNFKI